MDCFYRKFVTFGKRSNGFPVYYIADNPASSADESPEEAPEEKPTEEEAVEKPKEQAVPIDVEPGPGKDEKPGDKIPERPDDAMSGKEFMESIRGLSPEERQKKIIEELEKGTDVEFTKIVMEEGGYKAELFVMKNYLGIKDKDKRENEPIPMTALTAQRVFEKYGCVLPTAKIAKKIFEQADSKVPFIKYAEIGQKLGLRYEDLWHKKRVFNKDKGEYEMVDVPDGHLMRSPEFYEMRNMILRKQEAAGLVAGYGKDIIYTPGLENSKKVAIFGGWHHTTRRVKNEKGEYEERTVYNLIQPEAMPHGEKYDDYCNMARGVFGMAKITAPDGTKFDMSIADIAKHPVLHKLVSDRGPMDITKMYKSKLKLSKKPITLPVDFNPALTPKKKKLEWGTAVPAESGVPSGSSSYGFTGGAAPSYGGPSYSGGPSESYQEVSYTGPSISAPERLPEGAEGIETPTTTPYTTLGDSLVAGIDAHARGKFVRMPYHRRTQAHPDAEKDPDKKKIRLPEMGGKRTGYVRKHFISEVLPNIESSGIKAIVIGGGGNDFLAGYIGTEDKRETILNKVKSNLSDTYERAREAGLLVVAITMPPFDRFIDKTFKNPIERKLHYDLWNQINNWIMSKEGNTDGPHKVVRIHEFLGSKDPTEDNWKLNKEYQVRSDTVHPNTAGYKKISLEIEKAINALSGKVKGKKGPFSNKIPQEMTAQAPNSGKIPPGYKHMGRRAPKDVEDKAVALLSDLHKKKIKPDSEHRFEIDGKKYVARMEPHPANEMNPKPHWGTTVYEEKDSTA